MQLHCNIMKEDHLLIAPVEAMKPHPPNVEEYEYQHTRKEGPSMCMLNLTASS